MSKPKIGFIGIGIMGFPMACNLLKADYPLIAYNTSEPSLNKVVKEGAERGKSCAQVANSCDIIITMLPNSPDVQRAVLGEGEF